MPRSGMRLERPVAMDVLLSKGLNERPDELALVSMHERWTWRELDRDADRLVDRGPVSFYVTIFSQLVCHQYTTCTSLDERRRTLLILSILTVVAR